jgi:tetratricopeptide (TPR) repeat protein
VRVLALATVAAGLLAVLGSCGSVRGFMVVKANRLYRDGYDHDAAALYLRAGAGHDPVASYNLANVFVTLGESESARVLFDTAISSGDGGVAARSWYNIGVNAFLGARFAEATDAFRKALESYAGGKSEPALGHELSRAYELALAAESDKPDAGTVERDRFGVGGASGDIESLTLSTMNERTLFAPGHPETGSMVDQ